MEASLANINITDGKCHDSNELDEIEPEPLAALYPNKEVADELENAVMYTSWSELIKIVSLITSLSFEFDDCDAGTSELWVLVVEILYCG